MQRFFVAFVLVCCALSVVPRAGRASELIDMSQLGDQGVVFESPAIERGNIEDARGIGDFNGDGFDDIVVLYREPRLGPDAPPRRAAVLVYGGPRGPGRYVLGSDLPGSAVFRPSECREF